MGSNTVTQIKDRLTYTRVHVCEHTYIQQVPLRCYGVREPLRNSLSWEKIRSSLGEKTERAYAEMLVR